ncbi:hypothetical protein BGZ61DRAFT_465357 [Ilyonectria robusta]|uniref:uncharacterized protein n=1 Tax=Ilyonectria robusta TaxID=1079257 RepID=UPI001E8C9F27|nr:uncharacterized protein BGZ61DRAFT_465357 [Ilyonectria robusta]KAH8659450.1 hypothetical protein BGZ61DRAFT_465357 [Ilyonectria robusta]
MFNHAPVHNSRFLLLDENASPNLRRSPVLVLEWSFIHDSINCCMHCRDIFGPMRES